MTQGGHVRRRTLPKSGEVIRANQLEPIAGLPVASGPEFVMYIPAMVGAQGLEPWTR